MNATTTVCRVVARTGSDSHTAPVFHDRPIFYRERSAGLYGTAAYVLSSDSPYMVMVASTSLLYSLIVYWSTGLRPGIGEPWRRVHLSESTQVVQRGADAPGHGVALLLLSWLLCMQVTICSTT